jgi:hypothetical protein
MHVRADNRADLLSSQLALRTVSGLSALPVAFGIGDPEYQAQA